ncbi:PaaI family thioesterase [Bradyrhizobium sp. 33ap4]|uniref:PaaI family thioesterase n=1 Tax=Bradyrhizobium sp. 33ap4 TaxID=3061630 RepID=UPI00292FD4BC|nr:PaaI family thioesterase [Bradyrhizobium sp. 33ap4]
MHDDKKSVTLDQSKQVGSHIATEGEFAGWTTFYDAGFENLIGPFWYRQESDGSMRCAFRAEKKHLRDSGVVHGGCLMTFADLCLFVTAIPVLQGHGVTIHLSGDFIDVGREGDLIVGTGEIIRAGGSLIFARGQLTAGERTLFAFSGTIKRLRPKAGPRA